MQRSIRKKNIDTGKVGSVLATDPNCAVTPGSIGKHTGGMRSSIRGKSRNAIRVPQMRATQMNRMGRACGDFRASKDRVIASRGNVPSLV